MMDQIFPLSIQSSLAETALQSMLPIPDLAIEFADSLERCSNLFVAAQLTL